MSDLSKYAQLAQRLLGRPFNDLQLLETAFTHCSYLNENRFKVREHNERLEFLGDAVLEIVVTDHLYRQYQQPEGILTNWRAALVRTESLAQAAHKLNLDAYLRLSKGEQHSTARAKDQILANVFEALIGAIYLDQGYKVVADFIQQTIISTLPNILKSGSWLDAKTRLQEYVQNLQGQTPIYRVLTEAGPDHDKVFSVGVYVDDKLYGQGQGYSKQAAQQMAAEAALKAQNVQLPEVDGTTN